MIKNEVINNIFPCPVYITHRESDLDSIEEKDVGDIIKDGMRELGYSDTSVNRSMKSLIKDFYNVLLNCENYKKKTVAQKKIFLNNYLNLNNADKANSNIGLVEYFDKYQSFCLDLSLDNVLKGDFNFTNEYI